MKTFEELEKTKPSFDDLERTIVFRTPTYDPNEEVKKFQKTIDDSEKLKISLSDSEDYQESIEKLEKKKPIGFWEGLTDDALFKIPVTGPMLEGLDLARLKLAAIRLNTPDFDWEAEAEREKRRLDWEYGKPGLVPTMSRQEYLDRRKAITAESARQDDIDGVRGYINVMAEREERGYNFWGRVGQGLSVLPAWMFEFALTGGLYRTGSAPIKKLLQRHAKSKLLAKTGGWIAGSAVRTTIGMPQRVFANTMRRSLNQDEGWATAIAKGWGETFIEAASEEAGKTITGGLSYVAGGAINKMPFGSKFLSALQKSWVKLSPDNTAAKFAKKILTKGGYSNLIGEYGEERLATLLHGIVGTETFGLPEGADTFDRVLAGVKQDLELTNALSEVVVLSVPGSVKVAIGQLGRFANDSMLRKAIEKEIGVSPEAAKKAVDIKNGEGGIEEADKYLSAVKTVGEEAAEKVVAPIIEEGRLVISEVAPIEVPTMETLRAEARETIVQQEQRGRMFTLPGYEISPQAEVQLSKGYLRDNKKQAKSRIKDILSKLKPNLIDEEKEQIAETVIEELYEWADKNKVFSGETAINKLTDIVTKQVTKAEPKKAVEKPEVAVERPAEKFIERKQAELERLNAIRFKTAHDEIKIERIQKQLKENVGKWQVGQGVGWKVVKGQVNRGLRIVEVYPEEHKAKIQFITDVGQLADIEVGSTNIVDTIDLIRDKKFDGVITEAKPPAEPAKVEKQPWEMKQEEFANYKPPLYYGETAKEAWPEKQVGVIDWRKQHKFAVEQAIEQGKPVPREVLEEYKSEPWAREALKEAPKAEPVVAPKAEPEIEEPAEVMKRHRIDILPRKTQILKEINEALKTAPSEIKLRAKLEKEIKIPEPKEGEAGEWRKAVEAKAKKINAEVEKLREKKVDFDIDGGASIIKTKEALQNFKKAVEKLPETEMIPKAPPRKYKIGYVGLKPGPGPAKVKIPKLLPSAKGYVTDGHFIYRGEKPKGSKIEETNRYTKEKPVGKQTLEELLATEGKEAKFLHYAVVSPEIGAAESMLPIPKAMEAYEETGVRAVAEFKTIDGYYRYNQDYFRIIDEKFPDAKYEISDTGVLIAKVGGKTQAVLMPVEGDEGPLSKKPLVPEEPPAPAKPKIKKEDLPSTKISQLKPGDKEAGFVEIPPITTVGKIEAEHPNIRIEKPKKDIGLLQKWILTSTNQAQNTGNPDIIEAANTMADIGMQIWQETESQLHIDKRMYNQLPKEYRANKGEKFFELMDKHYSPEEIDAADIPEDVKLVLKHFKLQDETMRQEVVKQKRRMVKAILMRQGLADLQVKAEANGIETTKQGVTKVINRTKAELSADLAKVEIPDDWGLQWSHIQHIFFGQYELQYIDAEGAPHFIGRAETQTEAYQKLADWKEARRNAGFDDADKVQLVATPELHIPFDVLRISRKHFYNLEKQIQEAADIERKEIEDGLRGIIGKRESKQKWWGALMHRKGAPGYSQDFWRVWSVQSSQFNRWRQLSAMNRKVTPLIESIRGQGLKGWAQYLEETRDFLWGRKRSTGARMLDEWLSEIPVVRNYTKPFALERWAGFLKSVNYWRHLQTARFYSLNSLQLVQTLNPVVGEKGLYRGIKLYYSDKGQEILRKHKVAGIAGKLHEMGMRRTRRFERFLPAGASEIRNQGVAFLALYDDGLKRGMSDADATRYARLRGQLFTQFTYTQSDIPKAMRGPIGGLIFQYKRFTIKNLELVSRLAREGKWGGVARWLAAITAIGGLSTFLKAIPVGIGYLTYKKYKEIKDKYGEETADVIHHGLPGLIGIDMSGSVTPIDVPYGENIYEKTGNLVFGPTGTTAVKIIEDVKRAKVAKEIGLIPRALKSLVDSSPTVKQFQYLVKALEKDTTNYDAKQRAQYKLETWDLWKKAFGFRAETETIQRMQFEAMMDLKKEYDEVIDHIVLALIDGDTKEAENLITDWHASFPEAPISAESITRRLQERNLARMLPITERAFKELPKGLKGAFVEE